MSQIYENSKNWLTIDIEEITDSNFSLRWSSNPKLEYERLIDNWLQLCDELGVKSTCFVLGNFAKNNKNVIQRINSLGHEIASHGMNHKLVYSESLSKWENSIRESKDILEGIIGREIKGYRAASWSMPFEKKYYDILAKNGFSYSSSYFPFKTYMYGNSVNKIDPFTIYCDSGNVLEIPIPKYYIPFSGGFYLRVIPSIIQKYCLKKINRNNHKAVVYIHPYELLNDCSGIEYFFSKARLNLDFFLSFFSTSKPINKIKKIYK